MRTARSSTFLLALLLTVTLPFTADSQSLTGIWKGYFVTESGDNYKLEFQVDQTKTNMVTGVSYSYLDTRFYGKAVMTGRYTIKNGNFVIQETKTVEVKNLDGGNTCLMNYSFTYSKSGNEEFLEGTYIGKTENRANPKLNGKWGDCGGGRVFLRRVAASDFYVEPFLRKKATTPQTTQKPQQKPVTTPKITTAKAKPAPRPPVRKAPTTAIVKPITDTVIKRNAAPIVRTDKPVERPRISIPVTTRERKNELTHTLTVTSDEVVIKLYDNGEIDDDTISVYLDGKLILANKRLSEKPITYTLKMDEASPEHTLVMVAENLGRIPPNTSLMVVMDGDKRYQVGITSTEQKNAMVRFRYQKAVN